MAQITLTLNNNNKYDIVVETDKDKFFEDEYTKANAIIESIKTSIQNDSKKNNIFGKNNIIIFSGNRGTGKTSAMVSFGEILKNKYDDINVLESRIDPSHFQENKSILLSIITLLFRNIKDEVEKGSHIPNDLLNEFEKVFRAIKKTGEPIPKESSLEYLNQLSDSLDLRKSVEKLVEGYLKFWNTKDENKKTNYKYVALMIDDLDMSVSYAPTMLEQIRKFLFCNNLIILIATNIDQLQIEMQEYYGKYFEKTLSVGEKSIISVDVEEMATQYLLKLFPPLHRIHIGNSGDKLIKAGIKYIGKNESETENYGDLQKYILSLIWEKTRLIFIPQKGLLHPVIPANLRALCQFIYMLKEMKEVDKSAMFKDKNSYDTIKENFLKFKDYILNVWIPSSLSFEEQQIFDNIPQEIGRINKYLIQSINFMGAKYKKRLSFKDIDFANNEKLREKISERDIYTFVSVNDPRFSMANRISDIYNYPSNNSMGDILLLVDKYQTYFESVNENKFIEAVRIYYSMLLFETMFFDNTTKLDIKAPNKELPPVTNIQKLIGGTLYFPHYFDLITNEKYERIISLAQKFYQISRKITETEQKKAKKNKINTPVNDSSGGSIDIEKAERDVLENKLEETRNKLHGLLPRCFTDNDIKYFIKNFSDTENDPPHLFYHTCKRELLESDRSFKDILVPFFIAYYGEHRPRRSFRKHIYDTEKGTDNTELVRFDILSLLVNILNPEHTIRRYFNTNNKLTESDKKEIDDWVAKSSAWTDGNPINFLLPIYSVDLMLHYLRTPYPYSDSLNFNTSPFKDIRKMSNIRKYYERLNEKTQEKLKEIDKGNIINQVYNAIYNDGAEIFLEIQETEQQT
jgi:hypothetical protein